MIFTASSKFWPRVKKKNAFKLWNFPTDRRPAPPVDGAHTREPKGWESQEELKRILPSVYELGPPGPRLRPLARGIQFI